MCMSGTSPYIDAVSCNGLPFTPFLRGQYHGQHHHMGLHSRQKEFSFLFIGPPGLHVDKWGRLQLLPSEQSCPLPPSNTPPSLSYPSSSPPLPPSCLLLSPIVFRASAFTPLLLPSLQVAHIRPRGECLGPNLHREQTDIAWAAWATPSHSSAPTASCSEFYHPAVNAKQQRHEREGKKKYI